MKSYSGVVASLALLSTMAHGVPTKRQTDCILQSVMNPSTDQVKASISQWNADVQVVNNFLNNVPTIINNSSILQSQTQNALLAAQDEPCQLMTLSSQPDLMGIAAFDCAVTDLMNVFMVHVLDNLNTIIANPADAAGAQTAVDDINSFRCCNVLPDVDILFLDSADDNGISDQVPTSVGRENACSSIICTPTCSTLNNGSNGK